MNIIFFSHPIHLGSQSMPRFTRMLADGMKVRGHNVEIWIPQVRFSQLTASTFLKKWLGYIDQYIIFPIEVRMRLKKCYKKTLFVITDHALGAWVPIVASKPHVIHCHDFLAQKSALGKVKENPTSWSGRQYQSYIRRGYSQGQQFISVSKKTQEDLHQLLPSLPNLSKMVYNGVNPSFSPINSADARILLSKKLEINLSQGYLLHIGGNQWYKNRLGAIEIYNAWRSTCIKKISFLMVGKAPNSQLMNVYRHSPYHSEIHFVSDLDDGSVRLAYSGASAFLFPSLAEGFGWPIAEAMASGCPVITTNEAPMTEVAGEAAFLIPRKPYNPSEAEEWAIESARVLDKVVNLSDMEREKTIIAGLDNSKRFNSELALNRIENIYQNILNSLKYS